MRNRSSASHIGAVIGLLAAAATGFAWSAGPCLAQLSQQAKEDARDCDNSGSVNAIAACTRLIANMSQLPKSEKSGRILSAFLGARSIAYWIKGEKDDALRDANAAIAHYDNSSAARLVRSEFYLRAGNYDLALQDAEGCVRLNQRFNRGELNFYRGNYTDALRDENEAIRLNPQLAYPYAAPSTGSRVIWPRPWGNSNWP